MRWVKFGAVVVSLALAFSATAQMSMEEEAALRRAGVRTDAEGLRMFFRSRTVTKENTKQILALIERLGSKSAQLRQEAADALLESGRKTAPFLREAVKGKDPNIRDRAEKVLNRIDMRPEVDRILTLLRLIRERKTPGALPVLLDYLPWLTESRAEEELLDTIVALGIVDGKVAPPILDALESKDARKRAAAALVLGRSPLAADRRKAYELRTDKSNEVRLRAGEGLIYGGDRRGVDILIDLLTDTPLELGTRAERLLAIASKRSAPSFMLRDKAKVRVACQKAWRDWATNLGAKLDLKGLEPPTRKQGYRLIVTNNGDGGEGAIREYTPERMLTWYTNKVRNPVDARVLPDGNILVTEHDALRVSVRDRNGKMLWARARLETFPHDSQMLPNGNVLIVTKAGFREETPERRLVSKLDVPIRGEKVYSGQKLPGGTYLMVLDSGRVMEVDGKNAVKNEFRLNMPGGLTTIEALPGGRYLVPDRMTDTVLIVDSKGKTLREFDAADPTSATMLPNGNILVGSYRTNKVVEIDCNGKVVWQMKMPGQVTRVRVR